MKIYKIFNPETGLYSRGGDPPKWSKVGKTWNTIGHLKNHLHMFERSYNYELKKYVNMVGRYYPNCVICEYEFETQCKEVNKIELSDFCGNI
mgnify:CR=1 FL=1